MKKVSIQEARKFSLERALTQPLLQQPDLASELLCFEAGQVGEPRTLSGSVVYQVLEGEALVNAGGSTERLGKGRLLSLPRGLQHHVENAGGGLLVVLSTRTL